MHKDRRTAHTTSVSHAAGCEPLVGSQKEVDRMDHSFWDKLCLSLLCIGGLNWGLVGLFRFDLVAWLFGGADSFLSRAVYILVAAAAVWCLTLIFRLDDREAPVRSIG